MKPDRITRVNELLRREIGASLFKIFNDEDLNLAAVTVSRVVTSSSLRQARVFVSVRGNDQEKQHAIKSLKRRRAEIQSAISRNVVLKYTPRLAFQLDMSIERGDDVLRLLENMENNESG